MFKICGTRLCGKYFAFDLPQGFNVKLFDDLIEFGFSFYNDDETVQINVFFFDEVCDPFEDVLQFSNEQIFTTASEILKIKRGQGECCALFYDDAQLPYKYYSECYDLTGKACNYNRIRINLRVKDESDDENAVRKVLNQPEIKAFFESVEYK